MEDWRDKREAVNSGWVAGKSAWETANAWVGSGKPSLPPDIQGLLQSHEATRNLVLVKGEVEMKTHLHHKPPSGPRNHDLCLWAAERLAFVGIESKADDGFDGSMLQQLETAEKIMRTGRSTFLHRRVDWLSQCLLGQELLESDGGRGPGLDSEIARAICDLPYQLFASVAGTLLEAKNFGAKAGIFIVHQFRTKYTDDADIEADSASLDRFISLLIRRNATNPVEEPQDYRSQWGRMVGPIYIEQRACGEVRWDMPTAIPLFIGKALTNRI